MAKGRKQDIDRRPGKEIFRELLDALAEGDVSVEDGGPSPLEVILDIISRSCPPGHEANFGCYDWREPGGNTCRDVCWRSWWEEGA